MTRSEILQVAKQKRRHSMETIAGAIQGGAR